MSFTTGSTTHLLQSRFPSSPCSSSFSSQSHFVSFHFKSNGIVGTSNRRKKKRQITIVPCCSYKEDPDDIVFSQKRAALFVGISLLPFFQLRARALDGSFTKEIEVKSPEEKEELAIQKYTPPNPFLSLLNGIGIFGTGVLGAFYALTLKEKKASDTTLEYMTDRVKQNEATILSLKDFESKLLNKQEEFSKQLIKAKEEEHVLMNQLNSASNTITGLRQELKNERKVIEELSLQIDGLELNLSKAEEDKKVFDQELKEKLNLVEALQDKINLLSLELRDKEENVQSLGSSLTAKELELKNLNTSHEKMKDEVAKAEREIKTLKDELLKNSEKLKSKNFLVEELNLTVNSLKLERDESNRELNRIQEEYADLKASSEKKAALDAKLLRERKDEIHQLKEKLELAQNEANVTHEMVLALTKEREDLCTMLDAELNNVRSLKHELQDSQDAQGKFRNEASDLANELQQSRNKYAELEAESSRVQAEFAKARKTLQESLENAKRSGEMLASEIMALKEQLMKSNNELQIMSRELAVVTEDRDNAQKELVDVYRKVEATANELTEEKRLKTSLSKELENLEKQIMLDRGARKSLETDLEEATKSLDEMNRNALVLSGELEMANSRISSLEAEKQMLYRSLVEQKNASKEAQEDMEDAHNIVLKLGKERQSLEEKAKKLEENLASAKGEILRLRSKINSSKTHPNEQHSSRGKAEEKGRMNSSEALPNEHNSSKVETEEKVTITAKRGGRRRRAGSQQ